MVSLPQEGISSPPVEPWRTEKLELCGGDEERVIIYGSTHKERETGSQADRQ